MPESEAATPVSSAPSARAGDARAQAPYRAKAVREDGQWHLTVRSLDDHPDRGEVDALVVTVTPDEEHDGLPAEDLDRMLTDCGFDRDGDWAEQAEQGEHWTTPCRQRRTRSAPPAPRPS